MKAVDLSCDVAGRFAAKLMAAAGFDVLRPGDTGALNGTAGAVSDELDVYLDAHKRSVDGWADPERQSALLSQADVVFTSFDAGRRVGLGSALDTGSLPDTCVLVTTSTFGTRGPYSSYRGGPMAAWSAGGYLAITGEADREPLIGPEHLCGYIGGYTAAIAVEAALCDRHRTGRAVHLDMSTVEAMLGVHQTTFSLTNSGIGVPRTGRVAEVYPLVTRPCRGGYVCLGVVMDAEFDRFAIAIGRPELAIDERFCNRAARMQHREALDAEMAPFLEQHDADDVVARLQEHRVVAAKTASVLEVLENPQLAHRGFWERVPGSEAARMPGTPVPLSTQFAAPEGSRSDGSDLKPTTAARDGRNLPLTGLLVIDFTAFWAGPLATRWLADLGAEVVQIERPRARVDIDPETADPPELARHLFHAGMNRKKRNAVFDLTAPDGYDVVRRLVDRADVLVENLRPGVMDRLGLGPSEVCVSNPGLVYVSLSGSGSTGPWAGWGSYGPSVASASSIEWRTGYRDGGPLRLGQALPDGVGGLLGALAALRGLRERDERGHGGWFDLSQLEAYTAVSGEEILVASTSRAPIGRTGNRSRGCAIQGVFPCHGDDQWIAIRLADAADVESLAAGCELPDLLNPAAATPPDDDRIERILAAYTCTRDKHELTRELQAAGVEAFPVLAGHELLADPHLADRRTFVEIALGERRFRMPASPLHANRPLVDVGGSPPRVGEHTHAVATSVRSGSGRTARDPERGGGTARTRSST